MNTPVDMNCIDLFFIFSLHMSTIIRSIENNVQFIAYVHIVLLLSLILLIVVLEFFFFTFLDLNETHQNRHSQINCGLQGLLPTHVWVSNLIILILTYSLCMRLILYLYGLQIQRLARRKVNWFFSY